MDRVRVIFVDDDKLLLKAIEVNVEDSFKDRDFSVEYYTHPKEAVESIKSNPFNVAFVCLDHQYKISDKDIEYGSPYIKVIKKINSFIDVVVMSGDTGAESLRSWLRDGADKILYKDAELDKKIPIFLSESLNRFHLKFPSQQESSHLLSKVPAELKQLNLISVSEQMRAAAQLSLQCANSDLSVMIIGDTGTGKELFSRGIHNNSQRKAKPFKTIDCTHFKKSELIGSELFGSEKGAFTGAESKIGLLENANGGTVFMDEVHHLDSVAQAMLLRFIQERTVRRVGGKNDTRVDVRLVFAAKPILLKQVENGEFLPDLYYRMKEIKIELPALSERIQDLDVLSFHFLDKFADGKEAKRFHPDSITLLKRYNWPGNVRELEKLIKRMNVLVADSMILPSHIEKYGELAWADADTKLINTAKIQPLHQLQQKHDNEMRALILTTYQDAKFNFLETSNKLEIPRNTLRNQCKSLGIWDVMEASSKNEGGLKKAFESTLKRILSLVEGD